MLKLNASVNKKFICILNHKFSKYINYTNNLKQVNVVSSYITLITKVNQNKKENYKQGYKSK